jgi:hypothetical protein
MIEFDEIDETIRQRRVARREQRPGPEAGDLVEYPDGTTAPLALRSLRGHWQLGHGGRYHLLADGSVAYSGGFQQRTCNEHDLRATGRTSPLTVWFFHHDQAGAHRSVSCRIPVRFYRLR